MLLEIKDLDISYGDSAPTVQDVELSLAAGEVLAIVGESGSGKTSVIRSILGVLPGSGRISRGQINFAGQDLGHLSAEEWRRLRGKEMAMIFQDSGNMMNPVQTIGHQFREYLQTHSDMQDTEADEMAKDLLGRMHLPDPDSIMASYTFELSGGMRQRVGIAMAIAFHPQLLLADEPTSALDVTTQAQIVRELMQVVRDSGTALVMVTHNIGVAACMADKLMVMAGGKVMEYGSAASILDKPQTAYTKKLLAAVPEIGGVRYV
ncbi:ABC transporter ATP-binding protein [Selenomonas caprae]|uniref:ABC transporter ATP-binding protein n=1 Tax=Selenomonas caprae TaxID=2606905 RepID=A0A5D6WFA0_9FIRM|nr:ABC transporter ATP-binding protein [Selenomonas caprae]TYZ26696.1 ABC transporter ATP-binding protein [Selenomonas caprae]